MMERITFDGNFCDISQCRELPCQHGGNCSQKQVWERLKAYEDTGLTPEVFQSYVVFLQDLIGNQKASEALDRFRWLAEADKDGRVVVLPFTSGRTLLCEENIDRPRLMKDVEPAIRYCSSCGIVFHMGYNVFCDLVEHGRITAVSEETEKALEVMKK
jgi:hypothetical protein|nr:MAG: hypothetical protein [Bacteriophage sp.]